uniref:Uncharacterized protein n=1 Tax=Arundo donax TaxID=35708 RepID=A0A0A9BX33_ARUDO
MICFELYYLFSVYPLQNLLLILFPNDKALMLSFFPTILQ